ncbi:hypothetical protein [Serratia aquatilis]|uniref:FidL-like membrane protein n=1 Tax=Serratia aquatilis TaxID=1737515 RepID=A0ABV6EAF0_9GAMM
MTRPQVVKWLLVLFLLTAISVISLGYYRTYPMEHFSCEGNFEATLDNKAVRGILSFKFNEGRGRMEGTFSLLENGERIARINRVLNFTYTRSGNSYILISQDAYDSKYAGFMSVLLPDFYLFEHSGLQLEIYSQNTSGFVFVKANTPMFYCDKTP